MKALIGLLIATRSCRLRLRKTDWIDRTLVTENVSGVWTGSMVTLDGQPMVSLEVRLELQQKATKVTGSMEMSGTSRAGHSGLVDHRRNCGKRHVHVQGRSGERGPASLPSTATR
jgi:hypothetical protein